MEVEGQATSVKESQPPKFALPVDSEHKATEFRMFSVAAPHMRAFHLSWVSFFACFVSTFAAPPLLPIIRDNLNLTASDIGNAGIASVSGAVFARIAMGTACDLFGPRLASASLILLTAPAVYFTSIASSSTSFLLVRFFTGFSLSTFVSTQFWMSSMFSAPVVGTANGVAGGWGNLGGGATQLIMPLVFGLIRDIGAAKFTAWRIAFFIPALFQTLSAFAVLVFGKDLPDGNFRRLQKAGDKTKDKVSNVFFHGITNYRGWILALTYGYCFGVELTIDNIVAEYFYDRFDLKLHTAGMIAASFGLANIISRPAGGVLSDVVAKRFGMRGRLWALWIVQTLGGVFLHHSWTSWIFRPIHCGDDCVLLFVKQHVDYIWVVPFVIGLISGMTGGGGNVGAVLTQLIFFKGSKYSKETGIMYMGVMIIMLHSSNLFDILPTMGWNVLRPIIFKDRYRGRLLHVRMEFRGEGERLHLASLKVRRQSRRERGSKRRF
ncbi:high-affinity nitrate transporter family protein [Salix suchowensis]|nr:high-affinity nitrate transporter family protein [Salix suchowensis]